MRLAAEQFERILRTLQGPPVAHEKRNAERFPVCTTVSFARRDVQGVWTWMTGLGHEVSELGLGLVTTVVAERGARLAVKLPDGAGGWMMMSCRVAHSRIVADGLVSLGLEFHEALDGADAPPPPPPPAKHRGRGGASPAQRRASGGSRTPARAPARAK